MAQPIAALRGFEGSITVNAVTAFLSRWTVRIANSTIDYATTGQTADADGVYWMNVLAGLNGATIEVDGYVDHNATAAARLIGNNLKFRPGTGAAGTVVCLFKANHGFSAAVVVQEISPAIDAEGNKPSAFRATLKVDGAVTYINA